MKAQIMQTLSDGTPNPEHVLASRILGLLSGGPVPADELAERLKAPMPLIVKTVWTLIQSKDILKIEEKGGVILELAELPQDTPPAGVRTLLKVLVGYGLGRPTMNQPVNVSFADFIKIHSVEEVEPAIRFLEGNRIIERHKPKTQRSTFVPGPRWADATKGMNVGMFRPGTQWPKEA